MNPLQNHLFQSGLEAFECGQYFEAHEFWEECWQPLAPDDSLKPWLQGLIQLAVGLHHWQRGNAHGAKSLIGKAVVNLQHPPDLPPLSPDGILAQAQRLQHLLKQTGEAASESLLECPPCSLRGL